MIIVFLVSIKTNFLEDNIGLLRSASLAFSLLSWRQPLLSLLTLASDNFRCLLFLSQNTNIFQLIILMISRHFGPLPVRPPTRSTPCMFGPLHVRTHADVCMYVCMYVCIVVVQVILRMWNLAVSR